MADQLWSREPLEPRALGWLRSTVQLATLVAQSFRRDQLLLHAHSLTFWTLLSIVPLLALAITFVDLVGGSDQVLDWVVGQLTAGSPKAKEYVLPLVRGVNLRALGPLSGGILILSTIYGVGRAERALNAVWGVKQQRPWVRRIPDYLAILVVTPLLLGIALPLGPALQSQGLVRWALGYPPFEVIYHAGLRQLPTLLFVIGFGFVYWFLPNARVPVRAAVVGGIVAGLLFRGAQDLYVSLQIGAARASALYGAAFFLPLLMSWLWLSWAIVLLGAEVGYALHTLPHYRREVRGASAGAAARETAGLAIALECARAFRDGAPPVQPDALSDSLDVPLHTVRDVLSMLEKAGIVRAAGAEHAGGYLLGRSLEQVRVADVLAALRGPREARIARPDLARAVGSALSEIDRAAAAQAEARNLRDLVEALGPSVDPSRGAA